MAGMEFAKTLALSALKISACVYGGLCLVLFLRQSRMVYYPDRTIQTTPAEINLAFETLRIPTADGEHIGAWYVPAEKARGTVMICHGNAGNIGDRLHIIALYHGLGMNVLIFDYRGYGASTGKPTEEGTYHDARAAWNYLREQRGIPPQQIVICGRSLGGAVAAQLASEVKAAGLILEATFTSLPDMASHLYPWLPVKLLCRFRYNTLARLPEIKCPLLIAHSPDDEMIPYAQGKRLYDAARTSKIFHQLTGGHNDGEGETSAAYRQALDDFLAKALSTP